jgi:hypothetical protein
MMTAQQLYRELSAMHRDISYIANCIMVSASKPTTKLRNLLLLARSGRDIRTGNQYGTLRIDGQQFEFSILDSARDLIASV